MLSLVERDNGRSIDIAMGDSVGITLPENATTGYRWAVEHYDDEILDALSSEPHYAAGAIGSGGNVTFSFEGIKAGVGAITLKHWRHWEGDSSVIARFRIQVRVHVPGGATPREAPP